MYIYVMYRLVWQKVSAGRWQVFGLTGGDSSFWGRDSRRPFAPVRSKVD